MITCILSGASKSIGSKFRRMFSGGSSRRNEGTSQASHDEDSDYVPSQNSYGEGESSYAGNLNTEDMNISDEEYEFNYQEYNGHRKQWRATEYTEARNKYQYAFANDSTMPQFFTMNQQDAFFGLLHDKPVFRHKWIDWSYVRNQPNLAPLEAIFQELGLHDFLSLRRPWNDGVIKQFYATVEISHENSTIEWMTGKRKCQASFEDFASAISFPYNRVFVHADVHGEPILPNDAEKHLL